MTGDNQATILIVDDDIVDRMALKRSFKKARIANPTREVENGAEALDILRGTNGATKLEGPCIVLLDWNMPRMNGKEFLKEIREDPALSRLVVFVLTTSDAEEDRIAAYSKNVAGYIVKTRAAEGFLNAVTMLDHYWRVVVLP